MGANAKQAELFHHDYLADARDWIPARLLIREIEEEIQEQRSHLLMRLAHWVLAVNVFKQVRERLMVLRDPGPRDIEFHDALCSVLIGLGKTLVLDLQEHSLIDPAHVGLKFQDIVAAVRELQYHHRSWHGEMTDERRSDILSRCFPGAARQPA